MRIMIMVCVAGLFCFLCQQPAAGLQKKAEDRSVFACKLGALDAAERERHAQLRKQMQAGVKEMRELSDGYGFRLDADAKTIMGVAEWVTLERLCCPFFNFSLAVEGDRLWLRLTGPEGVKEFLKAEMGMK
jgi:hypothetical protein